MSGKRLITYSLSAVVTIGVATCSRAGAEGQPEQSITPLPRPEAIELRRVWAGSAPNFYASNPSPDGRLISEIDWSTGDLAVVDLSSGQMRRVTNKGTWSDSPDYAEFSVFSPDGARLAYSWFSGEAGGYQVRTIRLDGSDMRVVFQKKPDVSYVAVEDWSRDGTSILATVFRTDRTTQIGVISAADGTYRAIKSNDWRPPSVLTYSPDGRFFAYDVPRTAQVAEREILIMAADGSREVTAVSGTDDNHLLGWLPDGSGILFHRRSPNARALMALAVKDGNPVGRPQLVRPDLTHLVPLGFSRDAYLYGIEVEQPHVRLARVDLTAGRAIGAPMSLGDVVEGQSHDPAWSPDGQTVAYLLNAPRGARMVIRSVAGELRRQIPVPVTQARKTQWTPDGSAVLLYGTDVEGRFGIHRVDLVSGATSLMLEGGQGGDAEGLAFWDLSPDGRTIYFRRPKQPGDHLILPEVQKPARTGHTLVAYDLGTGKKRDVADVSSGRVLSVSPDGKWIAQHATNLAIMETSVVITPAAGGPSRVIYRQTGGNTLGNRGGIEWAPDGKSILFYYGLKNGPGGIWQIPIDGGEPRLVVDDRMLAPLSQGENKEARNFRLSPDGRHLVFEAGRHRGEFWMMSGFAAAAGQK